MTSPSSSRPEAFAGVGLYAALEACLRQDEPALKLAWVAWLADNAGARKVYLASAAPPVRYPNVYGIDMPAASELVAHGRSEDEVQAVLGCDWLIYQDLADLEDAVSGPKHKLQDFDSSCFDGEYVTGIEPGYLERLQQARNDESKLKPA